jgi:hypothetical protein
MKQTLYNYCAKTTQWHVSGKLDIISTRARCGHEWISEKYSPNIHATQGIEITRTAPHSHALP